MSVKVSGSFLVLALVFCSCASMESRYRSTMQYPTTRSLEKFIADYPGTVYADKAGMKLRELKENEVFLNAQASNSKAAYEQFLRSYPDGTLADTARKRLEETDTAAFIRTCAIGTPRAFRGYLESRPQSRFAPLAASRVEFLDAVGRGTMDSYRRFLEKFPDNPFVCEARATFPALWLEDAKGRAGVAIEVGDIVKWRGVFGGSATKEEIRQKAFEELKNDLVKIGLQPVLLSGPEDPSGKDATVIFSIVYREFKGAYAPPPQSSGYSRSPSGQGNSGYVTQQMNQAAANNLGAVLGDIFAPTIRNVSDITISDPATKEVFFENIRNLNDKNGKAGLLKALSKYKERGVSSALVALPDKDGAVREAAARFLSKTGDPLAIEVLQLFVKDPSPAVLENVAESTKAGGSRKAVKR